MKKLICSLLVLLFLPLAASAATLNRADYTIASGNVAAATFEDLTAPWSGVLLPFDLEAGDQVTGEEPLFRLMTTQIVAPEDGTVMEVFAREGDDAAAVQAKYGALGAMEGSSLWRIQASTTGANNTSKNRELHVGETLYFQSATSSKEKGEGRVISVAGENYVVEITSGDFDLRESLSLYRDNNYQYSDKVGSGTVFRRDPVSLTGAGRVEQVHVQRGDIVKAGDVLFTLLGADADPGALSTVSAGEAGVLAALYVTPGQSVWKGARLARVSHTGKLEVIAEVDEMDLPNLRVGDTCPVVLDMDEDTVLNGTVTEISSLGVTRQNAAYYQVHLSLSSADVPLGASASIYLPKR